MYGILSGYLTAIFLFTNQICTECIIIGGLIHPMKGNADSRIWELLNVESGFGITDKPQTPLKGVSVYEAGHAI